MADWQRELDIVEEFKQAKNYEIACQELAAVIAKKLQALRPINNEDIEWERQNLIDEFEDFAADHDLEDEDFNDLFNRLYDWGNTKISGNFFDAKKVCWIKTF